MQQFINILLFYIYMKLNMFRGHTAHHQEPKTELAASGFSYVEGCWTCSWWKLSGTVCLTTSTKLILYVQNGHFCKAEQVIKGVGITNIRVMKGIRKCDLFRKH